MMINNLKTKSSQYLFGAPEKSNPWPFLTKAFSSQMKLTDFKTTSTSTVNILISSDKTTFSHSCSLQLVGTGKSNMQIFQNLADRS